MNHHSLIDRFCESPRRWLIVTAVTTLLAFAAIVPLADHYLALAAAEAEKTEELAQALQTAEALPAFRDRVAQTTTRLEQLEQRTLADEAVGDFRNRLIEMARESGCQVRRIGVGGVRRRDWHEEDLPLAAGDNKKKNTSGKKTGFVLETRPVSLSVSGSIQEVRDLLARVESSNMMMHAKQMELRTDGRSRRIVQLELELWCFALDRGKAKT